MFGVTSLHKKDGEKMQEMDGGKMQEINQPPVQWIKSCAVNILVMLPLIFASAQLYPNEFFISMEDINMDIGLSHEETGFSWTPHCMFVYRCLCSSSQSRRVMERLISCSTVIHKEDVN